jgi:hypothetical protein
VNSAKEGIALGVGLMVGSLTFSFVAGFVQKKLLSK